MAKLLAAKNSMGGQNFSPLVTMDCRYFRIEVRTPNGGRRIYSIKNSNKRAARKEAEEIIRNMVETFQDERIMWRMTGDKNWTFGTRSNETRVEKRSLFDKVVDYFFALD